MKVINTSRKVFIKRASCQRQPCELEIQRKMNIYRQRSARKSKNTQENAR